MLSVSTNIQSPAVIVTVKLSDRMPDIDSISVAFPVRSMRSAEHFVMNATEEEARRGFAKVMSAFGEFLGHVGEHEKPRGSHRMMPSTGVKITTIIS